ncbi:wax ester/triacylglycerol synthase domain-containing protein [Rhodococcus sp. 14-1411-2a]|uniref:wax ester/triacylglycerol synthase domain-containing protein n=1 Tax=Rhodococcus sp. 14-1411-2a TaxID=2023151 RepID=UPI0015C5BA4A|nr:wax ester/triacylglycerol synthase domain-containing protein [Rhodococcus sp. 14-1411-2a]
MDRLDIKDAIYHFARDRGDSRDQFSLTAFDSVERPAPSFDEIVAHMEARAPLVPGLGLRLREAPLNLDYPRWVPDTSPLSERMSDHDLGGAPWADFEILMGDLLRTRLDLREHSWHLHVVRGIGSAPMMQGAVTVVILQVGHALTDGLGVSRMVRALFEPVSEPISAPGAAPSPNLTAERENPVSSTLGAVVRAPVDLVRSRWEARRAVRAYRGSQPGPPSVPATALNQAVGPYRVVRIVPMQKTEVRAGAASVTVSALCAVGSCLNQYLGDGDGDGDEPLSATGGTVAAFVPMALPRDVEWPAANRAVVGTVDLHVGEPDIAKRAELITRSLAAERARVTAAPLLRVARADERVPAPIVQFVQGRRFRQHDRSPSHVGAKTTVVSVDRGRADLELYGAVARFSAGFPFLEDGRCLNHGIFGLGDVVTIAMVACPDAVPNLDAYTQGLVDRLRRHSEQS